MNYLLERENGDRYIETRTQAPASYLAVVPDELMSEDPSALDVVEVTDSQGQVHKQIKVNEEKAEISRVKKEAQVSANELHAKEKEEAKARLKATDWQSIKSVVELKAIVEDLVKSL